MNNRDPFNLHRAAPAVHLLRFSARHAATRAVTSAAQYTQQVADSSAKLLESGKQVFESKTAKYIPESVRAEKASAALSPGTEDESMSFKLPRNVPSFADPQRRFEDQVWGTTGRSRFSGTGHGGGGVADRIGGMFDGGSGGLPMYKDKPYYAASRRKSVWRKNGVYFFLLLTVFGFLYWKGLLSHENVKRVQKGGSSFWKSTQTHGKPDWDERREKVRDAFKISWKAYEDYGWGFDEYRPISKTNRQMVPPNGVGWIIVDALDTLMLMNLTTELAHARDWISTTLDYNRDHEVNTFETTIRMLGGLLSAHYLSTAFPDMAPLPAGTPKNEDLYLEKASDLADRLLGAYESSSGVPYASVNLRTSKGILSHADGGASSTAEATSLQLEMKYLAKLTGETHYWETAEKVMQVVDDNGAEDGLVPIFIYADQGTFRGSNIRLGSRGDSYYEYLIKQYLQTTNQEPIYLDMWEQALRGIRKHLVTYSFPSNFTLLAERPNGIDGHIEPKMDHLVCFMPGTIALAATGGVSVAQAKQSGKWSKQQEEDLDLAKELTKTCWAMYKAPVTGLAPEIAHFHLHDPPHMLEEGKLASPDHFSSSDPDDASWRSDIIIKPLDAHNLQRPETVESLFYMWRITGDEIYRHWGWEMFQSFVRHTAVDDGAGFTSIGDVTKIPPSPRDNMESFWLAETLKYFYLLFSPNDLLPLESVVFNTEAHPFPRFELGKLFKTGWKRKPRGADGTISPGAQSRDGTEPNLQDTHVKRSSATERNLEGREIEDSAQLPRAEDSQ
ncbi:seven-hairpin glycosidase [Eremomyces bilateralis CBS 781.70]|uniref:alpha-1,2-Mannosidase n=1 Tax=Eremomyces bilateralis CBS 781.70 TaxID=1392243 RepID=A0A6G1GBT4_9PEZI|nr:seven-hairpin glycosidase [Eremomyces bilateralis CBS 781.70]KAF1815406.1 seven-hairpin glycosidase [Eremomyces bilateralis CBS 781.70]